jgi:hypothetical protein
MHGAGRCRIFATGGNPSHKVSPLTDQLHITELAERLRIAVTAPDSYGEVLASNFGRDIGFLTEVVRSFRQPTQTNTEMVHIDRLGNDHYPPNPLNFSIHSTMYIPATHMTVK